MDKNIYCGRGTDVPHRDFMDLINLCFNFVSPEQDFMNLLPKCYREQYRPQDSNYVVIDENGTLTAAVGAYDHELVVCGRRIPCRGIGNVGVHPDHRRRGYMKMAMNKSLEDMITDGIALSALGGRRQRYQYFGFDKAGPTVHFEFSNENARHIFGDRVVPFTVRVVNDPNDPVIDAIIALNNAQSFIPVRSRELYLDIANTWHAQLVVVTEGERFVGYCIRNGRSITEIQTVRDEELIDMVKALHDFIDESIDICLPVHQAGHIAALEPVAENMSMNPPMMVNVLNYRLVTEAFLALKLTYTNLPDGDLTLLIHGYAGDECIRVSVKNGEPSVEKLPDTTSADYELSHLQAIAFLFSPFSPERDRACPLAKLWFPLPLCVYSADKV